MKQTIILSLASILLLMSCQSSKTIVKTHSDAIRLNQIGYYPNSIKQFVLADIKASKFVVIDNTDQIVYTGELSNKGLWEASGENVMVGDFTSFQQLGDYKILVNDQLISYPFQINNHLYEDAFKAAIKSYYFQRASIAIEESYGGIYARESGHPDDQCVYHSSSGRNGGILSAPGGWYDAGDYGKYVVNASLTVGQMLLLLEQYPNVVVDGSLKIPESGNGIGDLWDELKYELDWILTMQDQDGGVYHKLTALGFSGFIMPKDYDLERRIIGKGTSASLNFAAVLAQASRLYKSIDSGWSDRALAASEKAWKWALINDDVPYSNPDDVSTGAYDDIEFDDDFYWAATELYLSTQEDQYLQFINNNPQEYQHELTNSWKFFVRNNAFHSLLMNQQLLSDDMASSLYENHIKLADDILTKIDDNPYHIALDRFEWGSNSDILNQAMVLCVAHRISDEEKYLLGAEQINDYIFGKNATAFCFLTGFGAKQPIFPHHRPSGADGVEKPVPGFIIGGPNHHKQDAHQVEYKSDYPARSYEDVEPSFASNEVCINWNAPAVYVLGYLEQHRNAKK